MKTAREHADKIPRQLGLAPNQEGPQPLQEDVIVCAFEECITVEQFDPRREQTVKISLSISQARDLAAALDLPEGVYRLRQGTT